jgi:hypothetical protein
VLYTYKTDLSILKSKSLSIGKKCLSEKEFDALKDNLQFETNKNRLTEILRNLKKLNAVERITKKTKVGKI